MSSRLLRKDELAAIPVRAWKPGGETAPIAGAPAAAAVPNADQQRETEAHIKAAYQQGYAAAESAAAQKAAQRVEPAVAALNAIVQELTGARRKFRSEVEQDTVKLAIAIARRVLYRELSTDPEAILGLVIAAFQKLNARETHRLRLSASDAGVIEQSRARLDLPPGLAIAADASLNSGSVIFETSRGELDASIDTQLAEISRGFADIVRRRA